MLLYTFCIVIVVWFKRIICAWSKVILLQIEFNWLSNIAILCHTFWDEWNKTNKKARAINQNSCYNPIWSYKNIWSVTLWVHRARLRDQMKYQPRCSKPVVKPLSLTLLGCSKCSGSMVSSHGTSGMPTSPTCTKTRVIAHPATTTAGSASSALQARYWPVSCWTGSPSTYWKMLCLRVSVASESRGARWIWSLLSDSSRKNVSSSTKTSTCSSLISPRHST